MTAHSGWKWASLLAAVLALWATYGLNRAPYITNDGYQYLDAASNFAAGECFCTNVAVFDEQVAYGRMPVPFTHFAPGYPLLIAALTRTGVPADMAGYLLSALGFLAVAWLVRDVALTLGAEEWVAGAFTLLWVVDVVALYYAAGVGTESLFTALLLGAIALVARDARAGWQSNGIPIWIGIVAALNYVLRYPGLFVVAGAGFYLAIRFWRAASSRRGSLAGIAALGILTGAVQFHNAVASGSWKGGFSNGVGHSMSISMVESLRSLIHLIVGDRVPTRLDIWTVAIALPAAMLLFGVLKAWREQPSGTSRAAQAAAWAIFMGLIYCAGVYAATVTTIAADLPRYYFPMLPLLLACFAAACSTVTRGLGKFLIVFLVIAIAVGQGRGFRVPASKPDWILTREILNEPAESADSLLAWLRSHARPENPLLAVEGQAVQYILQRPVIALLPASDTSRLTGEESFHALMRERGTRYLLVLPGAPPDRTPEQESYPFLRAVAAGVVPPWLQLAARTRDAAVYECVDCVN